MGYTVLQNFAEKISVFVNTLFLHILDRFYLAKYKFFNKPPYPYSEEIVMVDPERVKYSIPNYRIPNGYRRHGILKGDWDKDKRKLENTSWKGLRQRFVEGRNWEDTDYYENGVKRITEGTNLPIKRADGAKSVEEFQKHLKNIEELYSSIQGEGYRDESTIKVIIGRDGNWIVLYGYHRLMISKTLDIEQVPLEIRFRHRKWQNKREKVYSTPELKNTMKKPDHPDLEVSN